MAGAAVAVLEPLVAAGPAVLDVDAVVPAAAVLELIPRQRGDAHAELLVVHTLLHRVETRLGPVLLYPVVAGVPALSKIALRTKSK